MQKSIILRTTACLAISVGLSGCADVNDLQTIDPNAAEAFLEENGIAWENAAPIAATGTASMAGNIILTEGDSDLATEGTIGDLTLQVNFLTNKLSGEATNFNIFEEVGTDQALKFVFVESTSGALVVDGITLSDGGETVMTGYLSGDLTTFGGEVFSVNNSMVGEFKNAGGVGVVGGAVLAGNTGIEGLFVAVAPDAFDVQP